MTDFHSPDSSSLPFPLLDFTLNLNSPLRRSVEDALHASEYDNVSANSPEAVLAYLYSCEFKDGLSCTVLLMIKQIAREAERYTNIKHLAPDLFTVFYMFNDEVLVDNPTSRELTIVIQALFQSIVKKDEELALIIARSFADSHRMYVDIGSYEPVWEREN